MHHSHPKKKRFFHPDTALVVSLLVFILLIIGFSCLLIGVIFPQQGTRACTQEARLCPDGSTVSRTGPACEFAPCERNLPDHPGIVEEPLEASPAKKEVPAPPESKQKKTACTQEVRLCSDGSFVARTGPQCDYAPCPDDLELDTDR